MHHLYDIRNEEALTYDPHGFASLFSCSEAKVDFGRLLPEERGLESQTSFDSEDNAHILGGMLSYPSAAGNEVFVIRGSWVVARPGETFGYVNRGGKPVTLFRFRPKSAKSPPPGQRIYKPVEPRAATPTSAPSGAPRQIAYETPSSRGEVLSLHPGEHSTFHAAFCCATLVTSGRVMALFGREKISLDSGEGIAFVGERGELIGVGGLSTVALFTTLV